MSIRFMGQDGRISLDAKCKGVYESVEPDFVQLVCSSVYDK